MNYNEFKVLVSETKPLIDNNSGINVIRTKANGEEEVIPCTLTGYAEDSIGPIKELDQSVSRKEKSFSPKAILNINDTYEAIYKYPLKIVVEKIKKGKDIYDDYFKEMENQKE